MFAALDALGVFAILEMWDVTLRKLITHWQKERAMRTGKSA